MPGASPAPAVICRFLEAGANGVESLAQSQISDQLAVGRTDGTIDILDSKDFSFLKRYARTIESSSNRKLIYLDERPFGGNFLVSGGLSGRINVWSDALQRVVASSDSYGGPVYDICQLAPSPNHPACVRVAVACDDGAVRAFRIGKESGVLSFGDQGTEEAKLRPTDPIEITLEKVLCREPQSKALSVTLYGDDYLYFGTSNSTVACVNLKTGEPERRMELTRPPKRYDPSKKRRIDNSESLPAGMNVFTFLKQQEKEQEDLTLKSEEDKENQTSILCLSSFEKMVICGDSRGRVTFIDGNTSTILKEFVKHEESVVQVFPVRGNSVDNPTMISIGVDGRVATYYRSDAAEADDSSWVAGVIRYAHLSDCTQGLELPRSGRILVGGSNGTIAVYDNGVVSINKVGRLPARVPAVLSGTAGRLQVLPCASENAPALLIDQTSEAVCIWTIVRENTRDPNQVKAILEEARESLTLPETKSLCHFSEEEVRKWLDQGRKRLWNPVKITQMLFDRQSGDLRIRSAAMIRSLMKEKEPSFVHTLAVTTSSGLKLFLLDLPNATLTSLPLPKSLRRFFKNREALNVFDLRRENQAIISYVEVNETDSNHGFAIVDFTPEDEKVVCRIDDLAGAALAVSVSPKCKGGAPQLVITTTSRADLIFQAADEKSWKNLKFVTAMPPRPVVSPTQSKGIDGSSTQLVYDPSGKYIAGAVQPGHIWVYDTQARSYLPMPHNRLTLPVPFDGKQNVHIHTLCWLGPEKGPGLPPLLACGKGKATSFRLDKKGDNYGIVKFHTGPLQGVRDDDYVLNAAVETMELGKDVRPALVLMATSKTKLESIGPAPMDRKRYAAQ